MSEGTVASKLAVKTTSTVETGSASALKTRECPQGKEAVVPQGGSYHRPRK